MMIKVGDFWFLLPICICAFCIFALCSSMTTFLFFSKLNGGYSSLRLRKEEEIEGLLQLKF